MKLRGGMELEQLSQSDPLEGPKALAMMVVKELFSFLRAKALDHLSMLQRIAYYV